MNMFYRLFKDLTTEVVQGRISPKFLQHRTLSVAAETSHTLSSGEEQITSFRTVENNPLNHDHTHAARFYTVPEEVKKQLYQHGGIPTVFDKQIKTFRETCLMVRNPALEVIQYLKATDYSRPANRYIIYGDTGCGKTLTLAHILHFGFGSEFLLIHVPSVPSWMRICKEISNSLTREGYVDLNLDAAAWLVHFKTQNASLLNKLNLQVSEEYVWSKRETTDIGTPLLELVDFGIKRVKYASECVIALVKEVKAYSTQGRCKTLVVIDGFNAFFHPRTRIVTEDKVKVPPWKVSLTEAFLDITKYDWCNGAVVVSVDKTAVATDRRESILPVYQLSKQGFEHMDPFVPVHVPPYNDKEIESCLDYYIDRRWLQHELSCTEEGRKELKYLCGMNPRHLMDICAPL